MTSKPMKRRRKPRNDYVPTDYALINAVREVCGLDPLKIIRRNRTWTPPVIR